MNWMDDRANDNMAVMLDELHYSQASLIEIIVPINLPYTNNWSSFERINGSVEFNGRNYNYVMRRMVNGKMIYKCIPNEERNKISSARSEFFKHSFDSNSLSHSKKDGPYKLLSVKKGLDDYISNTPRVVIPRLNIQSPAFMTFGFALPKGFESLPYEPPKV